MQVHVQIPGWGDAKSTHVAVNDEAYTIDASALITDPRFVSMIWDGRDGEIQRNSSVPGKRDVEHFADEARVLPFVAAWQVAKDMAAARAAEAERVAAEAAAERDRIIAEAEAVQARQTAERAAIDARVAALKAGEVPDQGEPAAPEEPAP